MKDISIKDMCLIVITICVVVLTIGWWDIGRYEQYALCQLHMI